MFGIGANELVLILIFGFLIFGPDKLPAMAKTIGKAIAKFRNAQDEMNKVIKDEVFDPTAEDPFKNPLDAASKLEKAAKKEDQAESFTERKARYDKQRAARKRAEERKAELAAKKAEREAAHATEEGATAAAAATVGAVAQADASSASAEASGEKASSGATAQPAENTKDDAKPAVSLDDLYGTKSAAKKPAPKKTAEPKPAAAVASGDQPVAEAATEEKGE